jgi:hypothetical protein
VTGQKFAASFIAAPRFIALSAKSPAHPTT